jgi:hypothetical protein
MGNGEPGESYGAGLTVAGPGATTLTGARPGANSFALRDFTCAVSAALTGEGTTRADMFWLPPSPCWAPDDGPCACGECPGCEFGAALDAWLDDIDPRGELPESSALFAGMLFALRWRMAGRVPWPDWCGTLLALAVVLAFRAALAAARAAAAHYPAAAVAPAVAGRCARILLAAPAAPPVLAAIAGTTG